MVKTSSLIIFSFLLLLVTTPARADGESILVGAVIGVVVGKAISDSREHNEEYAVSGEHQEAKKRSRHPHFGINMGVGRNRLLLGRAIQESRMRGFMRSPRMSRGFFPRGNGFNSNRRMRGR